VLRATYFLMWYAGFCSGDSEDTGAQLAIFAGSGWPKEGVSYYEQDKTEG